MLSSNYTKDLLNLQDVNVIKVKHLESETLIYTQLPVKPHICRDRRKFCVKVNKRHPFRQVLDI